MKSLRFVCYVALLFAAGTCTAQNNAVPFIQLPLVPAAVAPGGPEFLLTVNGANFVSGSTVNWNGNPLVTTFVSAEKLTAMVPADRVLLNGTARITVFSPGPAGGSSDPVPFTITGPKSSLVFQNFPLVGMGITSPINVVSADFNNDGIADLAVTDQARGSCSYQYSGGGSIAILLGNGDGTFSKRSTLCFLDYLGSVPQTFAVRGDLNRDGNVDLVAAGQDMGAYEHVAIYHGNGDGTFSTPQEAEPLFGRIDYLGGLALGDFYSNGQMNLAISEDFDLGASLTGAAVYLLPEKNILFVDTFSDMSVWGTLTPGDFNGDGLLDLAVSTGVIFLNQGNGVFTINELSDFPTPIASKIAGEIVAQHAIDINGNGKPDFVSVDDTNGVSISHGNGDGTFQAPIYIPVQGDSLVAADFNDDGLIDLAVTNSATGTVSILLQGPPYKALVESPIDPDGTSVFSAKRGVVPVKFTLMENDVATCAMPPATIGITRTGGANPGAVDQSTYENSADTGSNFRIDQSGCQYVFNLPTRSLGIGTYRVDISISGYVIGHSLFRLQ